MRCDCWFLIYNISEDQKLRPPQLINFTSPYLHHQKRKWHDLDTILIASMSGLQLYRYSYDIALSWSVISEPSKFRTLPSPKFTFSYLHHQQCKWHNLGSILITSMSSIERCHSRCAMPAGSSTIIEDKKTPATSVDQLHIAISPPPKMQMTWLRQHFDRIDKQSWTVPSPSGLWPLVDLQ